MTRPPSKSSGTRRAWNQTAKGGECRRARQPWDNLDYGPFLSASIQADYPADNMTYKGVAVKLGKVKINGEEQDASICFDTQLMRMSAGWTGGFLHLKNVAYTGDHGPCPTIAGDEKFGTRNAIVWAQKDGTFTDPRIGLYGEPFGGTPRDYLHYKGLYRHGDQVVFSYSVNGMDVLEMPGAQEIGGTVVFTRTFEVGPSNITQKTIVADTTDAARASAVGTQCDRRCGRKHRPMTAGLVDSKSPANVQLVIAPHAKGEDADAQAQKFQVVGELHAATKDDTELKKKKNARWKCPISEDIGRPDQRRPRPLAVRNDSRRKTSG